jgi:hypothetical protein
MKDWLQDTSDAETEVSERYKADPTPENKARLLAAMDAHADAVGALKNQLAPEEN